MAVFLLIVFVILFFILAFLSWKLIKVRSLISEDTIKYNKFFHSHRNIAISLNIDPEAYSSFDLYIREVENKLKIVYEANRSQ